MEKITRCYRYATVASAVQRLAIEKAAWTARKHWNALVAALRYAEHECAKPCQAFGIWNDMARSGPQ